MLTARDAEEDLVKGFESGADDYLTKPFSPRELTARVRALLRRARSDVEPQADVLERAGGRLVLDNARRRVTLDGAALELTESEFRLLRTLARFPGRVYTRMELIDKVQGYQYEGYERTIDAHVKNLRRKLGEDARTPRLIQTVYGRGYTFAEDESMRRGLRLRLAFTHAAVAVIAIVAVALIVNISGVAALHDVPGPGAGDAQRGRRADSRRIPTGRRTAGTPRPSTRSAARAMVEQREPGGVLGRGQVCCSRRRACTGT